MKSLFKLEFFLEILSPHQFSAEMCSAIDGWGFTVFDFSDMLAKKLGCNAPALRRCLWGDYYLSSMTLVL